MPGDLVKINPKALRGRRPHFGRAKVVAIKGTSVFVLPFGRHRKVERVSLVSVTLWKSRTGRIDHDRRKAQITTRT